MDWNKDIFKEMAVIAMRAPSVHNVQPWKIQFQEDGFILLQSDKRRLHVGDPKLHDNDVSLGCFLELCDMFLKSCGLTFTIQKYNSYPMTSGNETLEPRFKLLVSPSPKILDPLLQLVEKRRAFRGTFHYDSAFDEKVLKDIDVKNISLKWITGPEEMKTWAKIYDHSSGQINKTPGYFKELTEWIRFSPDDKRYSEDGLNAEALSLGGAEALFGRLFFKEAVFNFLAKFGVEDLLITEAPQIKSAQGILVIYADKNLSSIEMGRGFVRLWLELTSKGLYACPLSALVDFTQSREKLNSLKPPGDIICLNVLRFGKVKDESKIYSSPRLDVSRVII